MSTVPTVRAVRPDEHGALAALTLAAYEELLGDAIEDDYRAELTDIAATARIADVLVAVDAEGRLLGGVTYVGDPGPLSSHAAPDEAVIRYLAVVDDARGRGVGAVLVVACIERAMAGGKAGLLLHTTAPMTAAQRLYERLGFRRSSDRDELLESGLLLLAYVLDLRR